LTPSGIDPWHFLNGRTGLLDLALIRLILPLAIPIIAAPLTILIPRVGEPLARRGVVVTHAQDMMVVGILQLRLYRALACIFPLPPVGLDYADKDTESPEDDTAPQEEEYRIRVR